MDSLDSLDFDINKLHKRSHRVRSWYLYEQYKSLERHQLSAAHKLKQKSYQERILNQELSERRARRKLCDQYGLCQSETGSERVKSDVNSCVSASNNDFYKSFCELQDYNETPIETIVTENDSAEMEGTYSQEEIENNQNYVDDYNNFEDVMDEFSYAESIASVVENSKPNEKVFPATVANSNMADDLKEEIDFAKKNISENINLHLETVKENKECLEKYSKLRNEHKLLTDQEKEDNEIYCLIEKCAMKQTKKKNVHECENNIYVIWTKLVSFAYQLIKLNHGNCYQDYSSQFLTAVLACDVIRRGVNKMCRILQPYTCPIKCSTDETTSNDSESRKYVKWKKLTATKKCKKSLKYLPHRKMKTAKKRCQRIRKQNSQGPSSNECSCDKMCQSENILRRYALENSIDEDQCRAASEPWRSVARITKKLQQNDKSTDSIWPEDFSRGKHSDEELLNCISISKQHLADEAWRCSADFTNKLKPSEKSTVTIWPEEFSKDKTSDDEFCSCNTRVQNPMLKLAGYIENILKDIEDSR